LVRQRQPPADVVQREQAAPPQHDEGRGERGRQHQADPQQVARAVAHARRRIAAGIAGEMRARSGSQRALPTYTSALLRAMPSTICAAVWSAVSLPLPLPEVIGVSTSGRIASTTVTAVPAS